MANRNRVDAVISEGQELMDHQHYQQDDIKVCTRQLITQCLGVLGGEGGLLCKNYQHL